LGKNLLPSINQILCQPRFGRDRGFYKVGVWDGNKIHPNKLRKGANCSLKEAIIGSRSFPCRSQEKEAGGQAGEWFKR
jgi:hypothetical protein